MKNFKDYKPTVIQESLLDFLGDSLAMAFGVYAGAKWRNKAIKLDDMVKDFARYTLDATIEHYGGIENVPDYSERDLVKIVDKLLNRMQSEPKYADEFRKRTKGTVDTSILTNTVADLWFKKKKIAKMVYLALKKMKK